jgi:sphingomyelin phosphodiesterase
VYRNSTGNPTNLFYQIVDRFSPHVIASEMSFPNNDPNYPDSLLDIFWGHTHEDQLSIFYANNASTISAETALNVAWVCHLHLLLD